MKYQVGNKVRVRKDLEDGMEIGFGVVKEMEAYAGKVVTISRIRGNVIKIKEDNEEWNWVEEMFEGLATFTKADLRDGDIVTDREGCKSIFVNNRLVGQTVVIGSLSDQLTYLGGKKHQNDIVKVERPTKIETVFERKEEPTELTISEIKEKFGIIGLLKIKEDE